MKLPKKIRDKFRRAGSKGGKRRAETQTAEQLSEQGKKAVAAREAKRKGKA